MVGGDSKSWHMVGSFEEKIKKGRAGFYIHKLKVIFNLNVMFGLFSCLPHLFSNECCLYFIGSFENVKRDFKL